MQGSFKRRQEGLMVRHLFVYKSFLRDQSFELSGVPGIEGVGPIRILRAMTPVFVHPHPWPGLARTIGSKESQHACATSRGLALGPRSIGG